VLQAWQIPTLIGLEGLTLNFQGIFPGFASALAPASNHLLSNSASRVLRF
jgi:hypothetical protein